MPEPTPSPESDDRLARVLAEYLDHRGTGTRADRTVIIQNHPELAESLRDYFAAEDEVNTILAPIVPRRGSVSPPPSDFGSYESLVEIGRGGMGVVYRARQRTPDRLVALKMIHTGHWATADEVRRFRSESESVARLDHPNIVPVYEIGDHAGRLFFSMKLCTGGNLGARGAVCTPDELRTAAEHLSVVARAVHHAHQRGVLHRDIKPSNILLDGDGRPYVTDFGVAKLLDSPDDLTAPGTLVGTPGYMAPEMVPAGATGETARAPVATTAVDVYGLGAVLYFLTTGRAPYSGRTVAEALARLQLHEVVSPRELNRVVHPDLAAVCLKCLEKDPTRRYSSAAALADDLDRWLAGRPTRARPIGRLSRVRRWAWRNPLVAGFAATAALSIAAAVFGFAASYQAIKTEQEVTRRSQMETARYAEHLRTRVYTGDIRLAHALWQRGESVACRITLDRYLPRDGEPDLRGWEWEYLDALQRASPREATRFPATTKSDAPVGSRAPSSIAYYATFSPDGRLVASAWEGGTIHLWDPWTGKGREPIRAHFRDVNWLAFVGDGTQLVSASEDGTIKVWDVRTGKRVGEVMKDQDGAVECIAVSPDGARLVSGGADGTLRVWDLRARRLLHELPGHTLNIEGVAFSPDGRFIASAAYDGNVQVWDLTGPEPRRKWVTNTGNTLYAVAFAPDGSRLAVARADSTVIEFEAEAGRELGRNANAVGKYRGVTYVPGCDHCLLAVGDDGRMRAWDTNRNELAWATPAHGKAVWSVACSPDGRFAVTAGSDTTVRVWALQPPPVRPHAPSRGSVSYLVPHAGGTAILTTGDLVGRAGERDWALRINESADALTASCAFHPATAISPDGLLIAQARGDGSIVVRDRASGIEHHRAPAPAPKHAWPQGHKVRCLHFLTDGRLAAAYADGTIGLISLTPTPPVYLVREGGEYPIGLWGLPQHHLALATENRLRVLNLEDATWRGAEYRAPARIEAFAATRDGTRAILGLSTGGIKLVTLSDAREELDLFGHTARIVALATSPDGNTIASACADGVVRLWHAATGQELYSLQTGRRRDVTSVAFTPDGSLLVAGSTLLDGHTVTVHSPNRPPR